MRYLLASSVLLMLSGNAFAMGGIWCETEATPVKIDVHSGITRGMGGGLFNFEGRIAIADTAVPEDLRNLEFRQEHVPQYWLNRDSLNLLLYRERDADKAHGYVSVSIETKAYDEGSYRGSYTVTVFDTTEENVDPKFIEISNAISCFAD